MYCVDNAKKCTNSGSCATGFYFYAANNSCLSVCPDGFYANSLNQQCTQCHSGCAFCSGAGIQACTKCKNDTTVIPIQPYYKYVDYTICNITCPDGYYEKLLTLTCELCHSSCSLCDTGAEDCQKCKNNSGMFIFIRRNYLL